MGFSQAQLDAFWARYVGMAQVDVISVCAAEPQFQAMLNYVIVNRLYGFNPTNNDPKAPLGAFGNSPIISGPTKS